MHVYEHPCGLLFGPAGLACFLYFTGIRVGRQQFLRLFDQGHAVKTYFPNLLIELFGYFRNS